MNSSFKITPETTIQEILKFKAYLNPFSQTFTVRINHFKTETCQLVVYNSLGQTVIKSNIETAANLPYIKQVDIIDASGIYFVNLLDRDGNVLSTQKIIAQ